MKAMDFMMPLLLVTSEIVVNSKSMFNSYAVF